MAQQQVNDWEVVEESVPSSTTAVVDDWEVVAPVSSAPAASRRPVATPSAVGTAFQDRDLLGELNKTFPGIGLTSGYRDKAYQADMRKRGYKPSKNSEHLTGDSVDISSFPGMTLAEGAAELRRQYPNAKILYGDKNHRDHVHFSAPGYGAFPALGGASEAGLSNPAYEDVDEGWEVVEGDVGTPSSPAPAQERQQGPAGVTLVGGLPQGTEIEFNIDKDSNQIFDRDKWLMEEKGLTSDAEAEFVAWLNANRGNKNITSKDVQAVFERLAPSKPQPEDAYEEQAELLREGKFAWGAFDSSSAEEAYRAELQKAAEEGGTGSQGNYAALVGQGLTANLADEAEGVLAGIDAALRGEDASEAYTQARNVERLKVEQAREQEGGLGTVAEIAASVPTSFALPFANAKKATDLAKAGAVSGAVYGFGRGDELGGSLGSAAIDAVTGALAAPAVDKIVRKAVAPLAGRLRSRGQAGEEVVPEVVEEVVAEPTPVEKLTTALAEAKPLRDAQDTLTKAARAERAAKIRGIQEGDKGESGFFASLSALKGEIPKVEAKSIRDKFSQDDVDALYSSIHDVEDFSPFDILNAQRGLTKLLGPEGVGVPTQSELDLLKRVFPEDVVRNIGRLRPAAFKDKLKEGAANALNLPRAIMSTLDLSAPLRQGIFTVRRKEFWKNFNTMFKAFGSEKSYRAVMDDIDSRPTRALMEENGLAVTGLDGPLSKREEDFMSNWAEKIPVFGRGARASNRAYTAFLAKLRADVFDDLLEKMNKLDPEFTNTDSSVKALAGYVNNATGRGSLGGYESAAPLLNSLFFSPRLISSRVQLLNPAYYMSLPAPLRTEALKDLLAFGGVASTVLGLAKASGAEVETDPRSTNFAKIKVGDTRYDILGGFQQYLRLASVIATNSTKTGKGEVKKLGEGFGADTRLSVLGKFARSKLSPVASYLYDALEGKDFLGEPFDPVEGAAERFVPMFIGDLAEAFKEEGLIGVAKTSPGFFGVGVSTYPTPVDDFGNTVEAGGPAASDDPVYQEVEKLGKQSDIIGSPSKKVGRKTLTKEQFEQYKQASGKAIYEQLAREIKQPEWAEMSPQEKKDLIKEVKREEREAVRNELFPDAAD